MLLPLLACSSGDVAPPVPEVPAAPAPPPRPKVQPTAETGRVVVVAVDGAAWTVMDPMIERGELPFLAGLRERGCAGAMGSLDESRSAVIWTSVATGVPPETHGVVDFAYLEDGKKRLYLNDKLLVSPLWELLSDAGVSVGVTHWWVTYPVVPVNGFLVSDHTMPSSSRITAKVFASEEDTPDRAIERLVYPAALWGALRPVLHDRLPTNNDPLLFAAIDDTFQQDAEVVDMTLRASKAFSPRVTFVYLKGIDVLSHYLWGYYRPEPDKPEIPFPSARDVAVYAGQIPIKYRHTDALLAELGAELRPEDVMIVLSDHGFGSRKRMRDMDPTQFRRGFHRGTHGIHSIPPSVDGIYVAAGGPIDPERCPAKISLYDVAPTVLGLLGQPVPRYMPGAVAVDLLDERFVASHPVRFTDPATPQRARRPTPSGELSAAEQQQIENLRALGYFGGD